MTVKELINKLQQFDEDKIWKVLDLLFNWLSMD